MSETTEPTPAPESEPQPGTGPSGAPEPPPSDTEPQEHEPQREAEEDKSRGDRRFATVTAKLSAKEREAEQLRTELEVYRRMQQQQPPGEETPEQRYQRERAQMRDQVMREIRAERFHEEGRAAYRDWNQRTQDLIDMGADAGMADLLIEMPGGVRIAAALAEDPAELKRIADIRSERGRAIALGKYAASIEGDNGAAPARPAPQQVTRAPAPIRPVTGRAAPQFNEYTADGNTLVDRYMRQDLERRMRR